MAKNNGDSEIRKTVGAPLLKFDFDFVEQQAALAQIFWLKNRSDKND